jgi:diguanylate cyclase (GGDEF)-like protein
VNLKLECAIAVNHDFIHILNLKNWNRKMLNAYWFITLASIVGELIYLLIETKSLSVKLMGDMFPSLLSMILVLLATEFIHTKINRFNEYVIIVSGSLVTFCFLYFHTGVTALYNALFLPILISIFYFQIKKALFSFVVTIITCFLLYYIKGAAGDPIEFANFVSIIGVLIIGTVVCLGIMDRGIELLNHLRTTMESRQELLVKNIIMDRLSKSDPLTELYNHITFHEYMDRLAEQSDKFGLPLQVAILDIDNFKKVNDTYGHRAGDRVLKRVAEIMQQHVMANDFVARYGGEEFAILFTEKTINEVFDLLEQIRTAVAENTFDELEGNSVTLSGGLSEYVSGAGKERLFHLADEALYIAKKSGKNRIVIKLDETFTENTN